MYIFFFLIFILLKTFYLISSNNLYLIFIIMSSILKAQNKSIVIKERVNTEKLNLLIHSKKLLDWDKQQKDNNTNNNEFVRNHIKSLKDFREQIDNDYIEITYTLDNFGRYKNSSPYELGYSYTNMYKEIRSPLAMDYYVDLDLVNCHPTILYNECILYNSIKKKEIFKLEQLKNYIDNREDIYNEIFENYPDITTLEGEKINDDNYRATLKGIFTTLLYGRGKEDIAKKHNINIDEIETLSNFYDEIQTISKKFIDIEDFKEINTYIRNKKRKENDNSNIVGCIMSIILQTIERMLLDFTIDIVEKLGYKTGARIHDGFHIEKTKNFTMEKMNNDIEKIILELKNFSRYTSVIKKIQCFNVKIKEFDLDETFLEVEPTYKRYLFHKKRFEETYRVAKIDNYYIVEETNNYIEENNDENLYSPSLNGYTLYTREKLVEKYCDFTEFKIDKQPFIKYWLNDPYKRKFDKMVFDPSGTKRGIYNTFKGFEILQHEFNEPLPTTQQERENIIKPLLQLLFKLSAEKKKNFEVLMAGLSHLLYKPYKKTRVCYLIKGLKTGQGKNTLFLLLQAVIGAIYCNCTQDLGTLYERFGNGRVDKLLVAINEMSVSDLAKYMEKIKQSITENTMDYEVKNVMLTKYNSFENYFIFTNQPMMFVQEKDRRFMIIDVDLIDYNYILDDGKKKKTTKRDFFNTIYSIIGSVDNKPNYFVLRAFYDYMIQYFKDNDIANYDFEANIENEEKKIIQNVDIFTEFIRDFIIRKIKDNNDINEIETHGIDLLKECKKYYSTRNFEMKYNDTSIIRNFNLKFPSVLEEKRTAKSRNKIINVEKILEILELSRSDCIEYELEF